jgi:hypothetical protein
MTYTVKPSEVYNSREAVVQTCNEHNLKIVGFRSVGAGESYLSAPDAKFVERCNDSYRIVRLIVAPKTPTVTAKWWE